MGLFIPIAEAGTHIHWHIGQTLPPEDVVDHTRDLQADGDELELILDSMKKERVVQFGTLAIFGLIKKHHPPKET